MDPFVVVSPHLDDAVLSVGQFLAGRSDCVVVTTHAGDPADLTESTEFDRNCGFANAGQALRSRRFEDDAALRELRAVPVRLGFVDDQYADDQDTIAAIADSIECEVDARGCTELLGPLGLAHPDHYATSEACLLLARSHKVWLYEELPSRVLWPELVCDRLAQLDSRGFDLELGFIGTGLVAAKARAIDAYRSQLWALDRRCLFVPERVHLVSAP